MKYFKKSILIFMLGCITATLSAQSKKYDREEKKLFKEAESFYVYGDFNTAIKLFKKIEDADPDYEEMNYKLGDSYYQLKRYDSSKSYLQKGVDFNKDALFYLAEIALYDGELAISEKFLNQFKTQKSNKNSVIEEDREVRLQENLRTAEELMADPEVVNIVNLGKKINTENSEYVPLISSDETFLAFTSRRIREGNGVDPTGQPFEDVYTSQRSSLQDDWSKAVPIKGEINTGKHDACVGLSPDGNRLFIYRSNENLIGGDLYESVKLDGIWTVPVRMSENINNLNSIEPSASLSLDGSVFYFSSNREGGFGGFDIYRVIKLPNGKWSLPKNLGSTINTPFDDDAPFIHPNGNTLYFSSKGHKNMGGFDVFRAEKEGDSWKDPQNMGYPTNTTKDDIYFTISANEQHGYYSSDKEGGFGQHDIYMINYLEKSLRQSVVRGVVTDLETKEKIAADISIIDLETADLSGVYLSDAKEGKFIFLVNPNVEYEVLVEAEGYEEQVETISFSIDDLMKTQRKSFELKPIDLK